MSNASTTQTNAGTQEWRMGHHPGVVPEMPARHSRGTSRVGKFCAWVKLVIRRPKRSSITGRPTARLKYQSFKGPSVVKLDLCRALIRVPKLDQVFRFPKMDLDVHRSSGLEHPALIARSRLQKVGHLQLWGLIPARSHGLRERSVNVREVLNAIFNAYRMAVEGIAGRPVVENHIKRLCRTVEFGRYVGAHSSCSASS